MLKKIKIIIKRIISNFYVIKHLKKADYSRIIYIGSPLHGNIGDHAISIAIMNLLQSLNKKIVEIPGEIFMFSKNKIIPKVNTNDVIVITGGGLIGNLWLNEEEMIKLVIQSFPHNKIIIMPQTYYFENNDLGKKELKDLKKVIDNHKNIYLCAREENSFNFCQKEFKKTQGFFLLPDVVLTLNYLYETNRDGILLCLRKDKEKTCDDKILSLLEEKFSIRYTTTVINKRILLNKRNEMFKKKLKEFSSSKLVITDRLHGMIFAAITGTPCIALDNKSKKVSGVYKWIKNLNYIIFCENSKELMRLIDKLNINKKYKYNLSEKFKKEIVDNLKLIMENNK